MKTRPIRSDYCTSNHATRPCGHLGRWVDAELQLGLLAVVEGEALHEDGGDAGVGAAAEAGEDGKALLAHGVVVGAVLVTGDYLLGRDGADIVDHGRSRKTALEIENQFNSVSAHPDSRAGRGI